MPTYEYKCKSCGYKFDFFQGMNDSHLKDCPVCKEPALKRLMGAGAGFIFKGSGFYETDYRSDSYKKDEKKDKEASKPKSDVKKTDKPKKETISKAS